MAKKTGGHIRPCKVGSIEAHNERTEKYIESVKKAGMKIYFFPELSHRNSSWVSDGKRYKDKTCAQIFEDMKKSYTDIHGQAPQLKERQRLNKKTGMMKTVAGWSPLREMVVPIKGDTEIKDFDYMKQWWESQGVNVVRIDLHKDEGHRDDAGSVIENFHAHIVLDFYDWEMGTTVKLGKEKMSELQTVLAISLDMERGEKKEDTGQEHLHHTEYKKLMRTIESYADKVNELKEEEKKAETRVKGLTTMLTNLESKFSRLQKEYEDKNEQYEELKWHFDIDSSAYKALGEDYDKLDKELESMRRELDTMKTKIGERREQLDVAQKQLQEIGDRKAHLQEKFDELNPKVRKTQDSIKELEAKQKAVEETIREQERILQEQRKTIETEDRSSLVEKYREKAEGYQNYIYRRWPHGQEAVDAIVDRTLSRSAKSFSPKQAITINEAISFLGDDPAKKSGLAKNLMELAKLELDNRHGNVVGTNAKWIERTATEVMMIAEGTHPLSAFLAERHGQSAGGGGASYATDLTNWDGSKRKR